MYREEPWTLKKEGSKEKKLIVEKLEEIFNKNIQKTYTINDLEKALGGNRARILQVMKNLLDEGKIKIVKFSYGARIFPHYQSAKGDKPEIKVIDDYSKEYEKLGLISIQHFSRGDVAVYGTLKKLINEFKLRPIIVRRPNGFFETYKEQDLQRMIEKVESLQKNISINHKEGKKQSKSKPKLKENVKVFSLFGYEIAIKKKNR